MFQEIKEWRPLQLGVVAISLLLAYVADMALSSCSLGLWHEPDCPDELLK